MTHRSLTSIGLVILLVGVLLATGFVLAQQREISVGAAPASTEGVDPLTNGDFDDAIFYWRPTNHFVAWPWFEWWGNYMTIPEFIDGSHPHHNSCYPEPAPGVLCQDPAVANHSQGYIRYGATYVAGIYQPVTSDIEQCALYTFEMYNRNDAASYHARVGIDTSGWIITKLGNSPPANCPPDGTSVCPDPYIAAFPSTTVWSAESNHPAFTWAPISVTAEAITNKVSVWTYAAPDTAGSLSTYWDYGSLVRVPFPDGKLPSPTSWAPSSFINVTSVTADLDAGTVSIDWTTAAPASTQVWYSFYPPAMPVTPTALMSNTIYFPLIAAFRPPSTYMTTLDTTPTTTHHAGISGVPAGQTVIFVALSRRPDGTVCRTEPSGLFQFTMNSGTLVALDSSRVQELLPEPIVDRQD